MIPENINNGPCYRIEPYPGSCGCLPCCEIRNAEQFRAWYERDRQNKKENS
jgi:hypothetical protein